MFEQPQSSSNDLMGKNFGEGKLSMAAMGSSLRQASGFIVRSASRRVELLLFLNHALKHTN
jgi:hypothetical protein